MGGVFSKKKEHPKDKQQIRRQEAQAKVSSKDKAVLDLKNARDRLKKYQKRLEIESQQLHENARKLLQADKRDRAKLSLKVKKFKEQQMQQADQHLLKVLEMLDTVEWETQQFQVFEGLKAGNSVLDAIHKEMSIEAVETLMEETAESQAIANEISRMIGGNLSTEDEDAVLEELAEIERMEADALAFTLPEAPSATVETDGITLDVSTEVTEVSASEPPAIAQKAKEKKKPVAIES